jgi:hypothetical protein
MLRPERWGWEALVPAGENRVAQTTKACYAAWVSETLTIRLDERLAGALREESRQTGLARGGIARQALESRLRRSNRFSVMRRYFGSVRGPADLSTYKAYRRSWGKRAK